MKNFNAETSAIEVHTLFLCSSNIMQKEFAAVRYKIIIISSRFMRLNYCVIDSVTLGLRLQSGWIENTKFSPPIVHSALNSVNHAVYL